MKIIQKIILISITIFSLVSCTADDENLFEYVGAETTKVTGTLASDQYIVAQDGTITVNYTFPSSFATDAIMQIKASLGVGADKFIDVTIPSGESTGEFTIEMNETVGFAGQKFTVSMSGLKQVVFEDVENDDGDTVSIPKVIDGDNLVVESNTIDFLLLPVEGEASFQFGWDDTSDFDIFIVDGAGTEITKSATSSNPEKFNLNDDLPDGDYTVNIVYYAIEDDNSNVYFLYRNSEGVVTLFNSSLSGYVQNESNQIPAFTITKSGIDYTITKIE